MDRIEPGIVPWKKTHSKPRGRIHVVDNCNLVVSVARDALKLSVVSATGCNQCNSRAVPADAGRATRVIPKKRLFYRAPFTVHCHRAQVNIGGVDIADRNKKLILAVMWQLMRRFTLDVLKTLSSDGQAVDEKDAIKWANGIVSAPTYCP